MKMRFSEECIKEIYEHRIQRIAYFLWREAGCPDGQDLEFWFEAEKQYKAEMVKFEKQYKAEMAKFEED